MSSIPRDDDTDLVRPTLCNFSRVAAMFCCYPEQQGPFTAPLDLTEVGVAVWAKEATV